MSRVIVYFVDNEKLLYIHSSVSGFLILPYTHRKMFRSCTHNCVHVSVVQFFAKCAHMVFSQ